MKLVKKKKYFISKRAILNKTTLGYKCNIAYGADCFQSDIGRYTSIGRRTTIRNAKIGSFCSISYNVSIGAASHPIERISGSAAFFKKKFGIVDYDENIKRGTTYIGHSVWIGCNAVIMEGVKVGNGAVIGAGAIVTKDVKPYEIVVGVPAKHLKFRFNNECILAMEKMRWWEWDEIEIKNKLNYFKEPVSLSLLVKMDDKICNKF